MTALQWKLLRDVWQMRGSAVAIAMVLAAGVSTFMMFLTTLDSLQLSLESFYRNYRFAEVFAPLKRAPESLRARIEELPGVARVDTRVVTYVTVDIPGFREPVTGLITSIPDEGEAPLNRLYFMSGRSVDPDRDDEIVMSEAFAEAHGFRLGDRLAVVLRGTRKEFVVVGTAVSPEYIHQLRPGGLFPDYERFGVFWMARTPLAAANDMEGAFNHVVLGLAPGAQVLDVIDRLDTLLAPYGGTGAIEREDQQSHRFLVQELRTLASLVGVFPSIFMGVAAFLLHVVLNRLVGTQRDEIAALKAFGYGNARIAAHYVQMVLLIVACGAGLGVLGGAVLGYWFSNIYRDLFELPYLNFHVAPGFVLAAFAISAGAGLLGALAAVRAAARMRPAEAMRPEAPALYHTTLVERLGLQRIMGAPTRMILRHLGNRPYKSLMSVIGVAFAVGILMTGRFQGDSITHSMYLQFGLGQREDVSLTFIEPTSRRALYSLESLPGVHYGEVFRWVPVRVHHGHRRYRTAMVGLEPGGELQRVIDERALRPVALPPEGIVINDFLSRQLDVQAGDVLTVEFLDGHRPVRQVPVAAVVPKLLGAFTYMNLEALNRILREGHAITGVMLAIDQAHAGEIYARIKEIPRISGIGIREHEIANFHETMDETMLFFTFVASVFSAIIALGIVYNAARITLTERSRELASLRVLGFTRGEISYVLLGELALLVLAAIPLGLAIGYGLCWYIARAIDNELYRVPLVIEPDTYAFAVTVVLLAAAASAFAVRRRLDHLDLIGVLKTRE
ncbi:MAG: ABC transporter permease [Thiohalomonadaceae bacterium]